MGGAGFPPCWLFGLMWPNTGAYWGSLLGLMADSGRAHAKEYFPELLLPVSLSSQWDTATSASAGDPLTLVGSSGPVSYGVTVPSPGSRCAHYFWSLCFPQSCRSPAITFDQPSKSDSLGIPPPIAGPPGWEAWRVGQNLHCSGCTSVL